LQQSKDLVCSYIDKGVPCFTWHWEWNLIHGYDKDNYYYTGPMHPPAKWEELGTKAVGFLEITALTPGPAGDDRVVAKKAIQFGIDYAEDYTKLALKGYMGGMDAYDAWIKGMETGKISGMGTAYHAGIWAECRHFAVEFLEEADRRTNKEHTDLFQKAVKEYKVVSENLAGVVKLFPFIQGDDDKMNKTVQDPQVRNAAIPLLKKAKEHEAAGLEVLKELVKVL
jgi:hypothetical protein